MTDSELISSKKHKKDKKKKHKKGKHDDDNNDNSNNVIDVTSEQLKEENTNDSNNKRSHNDIDNNNNNDTDVLKSLKKPKSNNNTSYTIKSEQTNNDNINETPTTITRVFCGNISFQAVDNDIYELFGRSGKISGLHWVTDKTTGLFYGTCMIDFDNKQSATTSLRCNGKLLHDRPLKVTLATGNIQQSNKQHYNSKLQPGNKVVQTGNVVDKSTKPDNCNTVFIGNCSFDITDEHIYELFKDCGDITDLRWVERDGVFKGCGFVEFQDTKSTDKAVEFNGTNLLGRKMKVDYAPNK